jgi:glutathione S-transferase
MLELYYFPTATCGYKARLTLAEKGVDFTHRVLDRDAGELVTPDYLKLNPNAVVPTMVHDGAVLIESSIIMVYTDTAFDGPALQPDSALGRARVAAWLKRADDQYLPALGAVTYGLFRRKEILRKTPQELDAYYLDIPDPERRAQRHEVVEKGIGAANVKNGFLTLDKMLESMEAELAETAYLAGPDYGLADAALTPFVSRLAELGMDSMWDTRPHVAGWWTSVRERPSFDTVFSAFPDPQRKAGLRAAGEEARDGVRQILEGKTP